MKEDDGRRGDCLAPSGQGEVGVFMEQTAWEWREQTAGLCRPGTCSPDKGQNGERAQGQERTGRRQPRKRRGQTRAHRRQRRQLAGADRRPGDGWALPEGSHLCVQEAGEQVSLRGPSRCWDGSPFPLMNQCDRTGSTGLSCRLGDRLGRPGALSARTTPAVLCQEMGNLGCGLRQRRQAWALRHWSGGGCPPSRPSVVGRTTDEEHTVLSQGA